MPLLICKITTWPFPLAVIYDNFLPLALLKPPQDNDLGRSCDSISEVTILGMLLDMLPSIREIETSERSGI